MEECWDELRLLEVLEKLHLEALEKKRKQQSLLQEEIVCGNTGTIQAMEQEYRPNRRPWRRWSGRPSTKRTH